MKNLFEVGEEVIFVDSSGETDTVVLGVVIILYSHCEVCGAVGAGYFLRGIPNDADYVWHECHLRKKYKPGDSFESIMDYLKQPIKQPVLVTDTQQEDNQ